MHIQVWHRLHLHLRQTEAVQAGGFAIVAAPFLEGNKQLLKADVN